MRIIIKLVLAAIFIFITTQAFSFNLKPGYLVAQIGGFVNSQGETQDINIKSLVGDHFTVENSNDGNVLFGLGYFLNGLDEDKYSLDFGINAFYLSQTTVKGDILQEHLFPNLSYQYNIS